MSTEITRIANPIYDGPFKYLMDDNRIARLFLSTLIGENIVELTFRPTEHRVDAGERHITVFRMDFCARILMPDASEKLVIIEIQKAKFATDIMRFRKYLGRQYASKDNVYQVGEDHRAMPILSIYFLGHSLAHTREPVIRVLRQYADAAGNRIRESVREEFIESLTHDSLVVQVPHLNRRRQNDIECLLGLFDQSQKDPADAHTLSIREEDYPEKFQSIIRRLIKAISEPQVRETMEMEDDFLEELEDRDRKVYDQQERLAEKQAVIQEQEAALAEKQAALVEKQAALVEKQAALVETEALLKEKDAIIERAVRCLMDGGLSEQDARARTMGVAES